MRWQEVLGAAIIAVIVGLALGLTTKPDTELHSGFVRALKTAPRFQQLPPEKRDAAAVRVARLTWLASTILSAAITVGIFLLVWSTSR